MTARARSGRPRKQRPSKGDAVAPGMSQRDIAATGVLTRRQIARAVAIADIPDDEFERLVESDNPPTPQELELLARRRAGKSADRERRCPHCGGVLWTEGRQP